MPLEMIPDEATLLEVMTRPRNELAEYIRSVRDPLVILGAGGKMGPTLAVLAKRAAAAADHPLRVIAVSRFSDARARQWLEAQGVELVSADLLQREAYSRLPDSENILYLVGLKFGTSQRPDLTWANNTIPPALVAERYPRARVVALSSGNVYPLVSVRGSGSWEDDALVPLGEYSNSVIARERVFEYFSRQSGTPVALIRLSFSVDLRYGVLLDIARKVHSGEPVDVTNGHFNCIWQGDANEMIIRSLALASSPPFALNLTSPGWLSTREVAHQFGQLLGKAVSLRGEESGTAFLSNTERLVASLGHPPTPIEQVIRWTAEWVRRGGATWDKPTHFEVRDGGY